jgi:hypothetical protein
MMIESSKTINPRLLLLESSKTLAMPESFETLAMPESSETLAMPESSEAFVMLESSRTFPPLASRQAFQASREAVLASREANIYICMFITVGPYEKAVSGPGGGEREKGGHVLRDTTSRGLCVRYYVASPALPGG